MFAQREKGIAHIADSEGNHFGMGIVVDRNHVLTCAHVINQARKKDNYFTEFPRENELFRIRFLVSKSQVTAKVVKWGLAESMSEPLDSAVLELTSDLPDDVGVATFSVEDAYGKHWVAYGRYKDESTSHWTTDAPEVQVSGAAGPSIVQLNGVGTAGRWIDHGYSGASVWCEEFQSVIGMIMTKHKDVVENRISQMIPTDVLAEFWPGLAVRPDLSDLRRNPEHWVDREPHFTELKSAIVTSNEQPLIAVCCGAEGARPDILFNRLGKRIKCGMKHLPFEWGVRGLKGENDKRDLDHALDWLKGSGSLENLLTGSDYGGQARGLLISIPFDRTTRLRLNSIVERCQTLGKMAGDRRIVILIAVIVSRSWWSIAQWIYPLELRVWNKIKGQNLSPAVLLSPLPDVTHDHLWDWRIDVHHAIPDIFDRLGDLALSRIIPKGKKRPLEHVVDKLKVQSRTNKS